MAVFALAVVGRRLLLSGWWRALRRDGEDFQPGCTPPTGGIEMNADEDRVRIFSGQGRTGLERNKDVRIACLHDLQPCRFQLSSDPSHHIEGKMLLIAERTERAAVMTAMAS